MSGASASAVPAASAVHCEQCGATLTSGGPAELFRPRVPRERRSRRGVCQVSGCATCRRCAVHSVLVPSLRHYGSTPRSCCGPCFARIALRSNDRWSLLRLGAPGGPSGASGDAATSSSSSSSGGGGGTASPSSSEAAAVRTLLQVARVLLRTPEDGAVLPPPRRDGGVDLPWIGVRAAKEAASRRPDALRALRDTLGDGDGDDDDDATGGAPPLPSRADLVDRLFTVLGPGFFVGGGASGSGRRAGGSSDSDDSGSWEDLGAGQPQSSRRKKSNGASSATSRGLRTKKKGKRGGAKGEKKRRSSRGRGGKADASSDTDDDDDDDDDDRDDDDDDDGIDTGGGQGNEASSSTAPSTPNDAGRSTSTTTSSGRRGAGSSGLERLEGMPISMLKSILEANSVSYVGCVEKADLVEKVRRCCPHVVASSRSEDALLDPANADLCVICMDAKIDTALAPCGHVCICYSCAQEITRICPICRRHVELILRTYSAASEL